MSDISLITAEIVAGFAALLSILLYMIRQNAVNERRRRELELKAEAARQQDEQARDAYNMRRDESLMRMLIEAQSKISSVEAERANLLLTVGELTARVDMNVENLRLLRQELDETRVSLEDEKRENARLRAENEKLRASLVELKRENDELKSRLLVLEQRMPASTQINDILEPSDHV
jgi:chromosome segregation ATPase